MLAIKYYIVMQNCETVLIFNFKLYITHNIANSSNNNGQLSKGDLKTTGIYNIQRRRQMEAYKYN